MFLEPEPAECLGQNPNTASLYKELSLTIQKPVGTSLGIDLDIYEEALSQVCGIDAGGRVHEHNLEVSDEDQRLQVGDFVVSVNGAGPVATKILEAIKVGERLNFVVRRPSPFRVLVDKKGTNLGIFINYAPTSISILVRKVVQDGAVKAHNISVGYQAVQALDRIVSINGIASVGNVGNLLDQIHSAQTLDMELVRVDDPPE